METCYIGGTCKLAHVIHDLLCEERIIMKGYVVPGDLVQEQDSGYPCISIDELQTSQYDFCFFCENVGEYNVLDRRNIDVKKSLSVVSMYLQPEYYAHRKTALYYMRQGNIDGIITGISSVLRGINATFLPGKWLNCCGPGQDLYYDFLSLSDAITRTNGTIKYAVMGIAPYSFRYDLSLSKKNSLRTLAYYRQFGDLHNASYPEEELEYMKYLDSIMDKYCFANWRDICFDVIFDYSFRGKRDKFYYDTLSEEELQESVERVRRLADKPYLNTLEENKLIFEYYLKLCYRKNIKMIVLIPPFSDFFKKYFTEEYVLELRKIINQYKQEYPFEILDLYDDEAFNEAGLYEDQDHLNAYGAIELTNHLSSFLRERGYCMR